mmetsp:Transcript_104411/g.300528  ORF Transcript_104411/g.300528 Transcript_104411/m.300528 type:complete len:659 (+) Transcript_104411:466-2442(+)
MDLQALEHLREADVVLRVKHGAALRRREAVAEDVDHVDVRRPHRMALLEDAEALVDERQEHALLDLLVGDVALLDALLLPDLLQLGHDLGVHRLVPPLVDEDATPAGADGLVRRLLPEAVLLAEPIIQVIRPHVRLRLLLHVPGGLPLLPEELLANQVPQADRTHRHAEVLRHALQLLHGSALLEERAGLRRIRRQHPIPHEAVAIADQDGLLVEQLPEGHACRDRLVAGLGRPDVLEELHHMRRREEVGAHAPARVLEHGGDVVDVQAAGVRADQGVGLRVLVQREEDLLLQVHDLRDGLDDEVAILELTVVQRGLDLRQILLGLRLRQATALHLAHPNARDRLHARIEPFLLRVLQHHLHALLHTTDRDAAAHQPGAQDSHLLQRSRRRLQAGDLRGHALREEEVPQGAGLHAEKQLREFPALDLQALLEAALATGRLGALDDRGRGDHALHAVHGLVQGHLQAAGPGFEARRLRHRPLGDRRRRLGQRQLRGLVDDAARCDGVNDAGLLRPVSLHLHAAQQHRQGHLQRRDAEDALSALPAGQEPELDLGEGDGALRGDHPIVAAQGHLQAAAESLSVHSRDDRLGRGIDHVDEVVDGLRGGDILEGVGALGDQLRELHDVEAAAKESPGACDDDGLHLVVSDELGEVFHERGDQ